MSKRIESDIVRIVSKPEKIYNFISNFDNFSYLLPEKVENWQSTGDSCSFEVKGLATLGLLFTEKSPYSKVRMKGEGKLPFNFTLEANIDEKEYNDCEVQLIIDSDMSHFISLMAANPLKNFIDTLASRLKIEMEK
jgi:carbon monoxide dehydrogenase subunit G